MRRIFSLPILFVAACTATQPSPVCPPIGQWVSPGTLRLIADPVPSAAFQSAILLGETHDSPADHRWQLDTIKRLYAGNPTLVLGFEMFPRRAQPVLDAWVSGRLTPEQFLLRTDWNKVWGFPPELYAPIFQFARDHRIPMRALNVSHRLVHLTSVSGWDAVPLADREGLANPAPPDGAYRAYLAEVMAGHAGPSLAPGSLARFIEAQTVWDSAMAQAIANQIAREPGRPVVAIMGRGHLENRWGVPHQLQALKIGGVSVLLPYHDGCAPPGAGTADALFTD